MKIFGLLLLFFTKVIRKILIYIYKPLFKQCGKNFTFDPFSHFSYRTITVGNDVFIGSGAVFAASESSITIGSKVMFGPNVTIMGGDHNTSVIGAYMYDIKEKLPENDLPVIIEDDVWVGTGVIILKGVSIGKGSIIAAGAVVTKSFDSYSVVGGVPAKLIKKRFNTQDLTRHESILKKINE